MNPILPMLMGLGLIFAGLLFVEWISLPGRRRRTRKAH